MAAIPRGYFRNSPAAWLLIITEFPLVIWGCCADGRAGRLSLVSRWMDSSEGVSNFFFSDCGGLTKLGRGASLIGVRACSERGRVTWRGSDSDSDSDSRAYSSRVSQRPRGTPNCLAGAGRRSAVLLVLCTQGSCTQSLTHPLNQSINRICSTLSVSALLFSSLLALHAI